LEKLLENRLEAQNMLEQTKGTYLCEINTNTQKKCSNLEIMLYGFPREKKHI
jgi:hypothetical protein